MSDGHGQCRGTTAAGEPCRFGVAPGAEWCTWHGKTPEERSMLAGKGERRRALLPPDTPIPSFKTREQIVGWAETTARLVLTGQLDVRIADTAARLADLSMRAHELAALDRLDKLERIVAGKARGAA